MAKGTLILVFILSTVAALLLGINLGKTLPKNQSTTINPTATIFPTVTLTPTAVSSPSATIQSKKGVSTFTDKKCGFSFSYSGTFLSQKTVNGESAIFTDPNDPDISIAATCETEIPKPPLPPEKIESITLDGVSTKLYHDTSSKDGSPRDEVIVRHPTNGMEIIVAGFGPVFQQTLSSFRFITL